MPIETTDHPTAFGAVILEAMRKRGIADASELGLDRLDLRALRRHLDGERVMHCRLMATHVADALEASPEELRDMSMAYIFGRDALAAHA